MTVIVGPWPKSGGPLAMSLYDIRHRLDERGDHRRTEPAVMVLVHLQNWEGAKTVGDLLEYTESELLSIKGCGPKSLQQLREVLAELGLEMKP